MSSLPYNYFWSAGTQVNEESAAAYPQQLYVSGLNENGARVQEAIRLYGAQPPRPPKQKPPPETKVHQTLGQDVRRKITFENEED